MLLRSTRGKSDLVNFKTAVSNGLAPDGGLYHPVSLPELTWSEWQQFRGLRVDEIAYKLLLRLVGDEFSEKFLRNLCKDAFNFDAPIIPLTERAGVMELFHGPTLAFKDFGARFMARIMPECKISENGRDITVLTATSGDTGAAVAQGFLGIDGIRVFVLYPKGKVSPLQERQFASLGQNITAIAVDGTFDDCQRIVKELFEDAELPAKYNLTSANSINIARLLPQMIYYIAGWAMIPPALSHKGITYIVPSGNFGNLTAGLMTWKMGLPGVKFIAATNANDVVPQYLNTGEFSPRPSIQTISNAMDVGNPSNFDRILAIFDENGDALRSGLKGFSISDETTKNVIQKVWDRHQYAADPHTATGLEVWNNMYHHPDYKDSYGIVLSTAHPAKFIEVMEETLPGKVKIPHSLSILAERTLLSVESEPTSVVLRELIAKN
jgi:threonine synthase